MAGNLNLNRTQTFKCELEKIHYDHLKLFRKSSFDKGQNLLDSEHIINVTEVRRPGELTKITAHCIRQASVMEYAYEIWLKLDDDRKVVEGQFGCKCGFGEEGLCKHFPALLLHINQDRDEPCTDEACAFIEPSKAGKLKYPKGEELEAMVKPKFKAKYLCPPVAFGYVTEEAKKYHAPLMAKHGLTNCTMYRLMTLETTTQAPQPIELPDLPQWVKTSVFRPWILPDIFIKHGPKTARERLYYEEMVDVKPDRAFWICGQTIDQAKCPMWKDRRKRIFTASKVRYIFDPRNRHWASLRQIG